MYTPEKLNGLRLAMVQMEIADEPAVNAAVFLEHARKAAAEGADIVIGSEMMLNRYLCGDRYEDDAFVDEVWAAAQTIVVASADIPAVLIFGGIGLDENPKVVGEDGRRRKYNAAFVVQGGRLIRNRAGLPFAIKTLQPKYRIYDDARHFFSLRKLALERGCEVRHLLQPFPVTIRGVEYDLGVMLCEDMWDGDYAQKPSLILVGNGADILIDLSCSNWSWRKNEKRDRIVRHICEQTERWFVYVNNVGCQNNGKNFITFDGASTVYHPDGNIVAMCKRYATEVQHVTLDASLPALTRAEPEDVSQLFAGVVVATRGWLNTIPERLRKAVIGVSGGKDSAASVALFAHLLGPENVLAINMPMRQHSSLELQDDARKLCANLGVEYRIVPIDDLVTATCGAAGIEPGTPAHKTAQAMARVQVLTAIGAREGRFFPCNANWTELAFGYTTLNADARGTFAPWANCLGQDVYRVLDYMNRMVFGREVIPRSIIDRPPMDELTAEGAGERKDPFIYGSVTENGYHDQMVRAIIAFRRSPEWFVGRYLDGTLEAELKLTPGTLDRHFGEARVWLSDLERCFKSQSGSVFKRVQSVPCPLLDKRCFGWDFRESIEDYQPWPASLKTKRYHVLADTLLARGGTFADHRTEHALV